MAKNLASEIDYIADEIADIDPSDSDAQDKLDQLSEKLRELKEQARGLANDKDALEEDASSHEKRSEELGDEMDALAERYQFAIRMLELGYGISENDLDWVRNSTPEDAFRKLTKTAKQAIERGDVSAHNGCTYAGACIAYLTGLTDNPCDAGAKLGSKGRFGQNNQRSAINPILHNSCTPGNCMPASLGWIPQGDSCS